MGHHSHTIHPVAAARSIPIAVAGRTVHCKIRNRQTLVGEARRLHEDLAKRETFCFACGRNATDFKCMK